MEVTDFNAVKALCNLLTCTLTPSNGVKDGHEAYLKLIEFWFIFSLIWSIGATVEQEDRIKIDGFIRKRTSFSLPPLNTVYDYYINAEKQEWTLWKSQMNDEWRLLPNTAFQDILVPTVDTVRHGVIVSMLAEKEISVLCFGGTATGKTLQIEHLLDTDSGNKKCVNPEHDLKLKLVFGAGTDPEVVQKQMERKLQKHHGATLVPKDGKKRLVVFVDDLNLPQKNEFGGQSVLEFMAHFMEYDSWYNLEKLKVRRICHTQVRWECWCVVW